ncbi:MAG: hypothetical protein ABI067_07035 [Leifsonia sp.]
MTAIEAVNDIIKTPKYYTHANPPMVQSTAYRIVTSIKAGMAKLDTEAAFLKAFGYEVVSPIQYKKNEG